MEMEKFECETLKVVDVEDTRFPETLSAKCVF